MKLISDFVELYDCFFDTNNEIEFRRMTKQGPNKREQFSLLKELGLKIPEVGLVKDLHDKFDAIVVYTNEESHCGEGKELYEWLDDISGLEEKFCSHYVAEWPFNRNSHSIRLLNIGERQFLIEYFSKNDWRSKVGEGTVECIGETKKWIRLQEKIDRPLWAIDFIINSFDRQWYAIDYNESPGIKGVSGLGDYVSNIDIANEIADWFLNN